MSGERRSIVVTGASSGIGRALSLTYAAAGTSLALTGRDAGRLAAVREACEAAGARVVTASIDVRDRERLASWIAEIDDRAPIDLVIAAAGISTGLGSRQIRERPEAVRAALAVNLHGVINTLDACLDRMCARGRGQVAVVGSMAALRGLPYAPAYCASKAAVHAYVESLRPRLADVGVSLCLIVPGFVSTPLNAHHVCPRPLQMSAEDAARRIRRGLDRGAPLIVFPRVLYAGTRLLAWLPARLVDRVLDRVRAEIPETVEREAAP